MPMKHLTITTLMLFCILFAIISCKENAEICTITIASEQRNCIGESAQKCYLIKYSEDDEWSYFSNHIIGFEYIEGFEYIIEMKIYENDNPPIDGSSHTCYLTKVISKKQTISKNLPK